MYTPKSTVRQASYMIVFDENVFIRFTLHSTPAVARHLGVGNLSRGGGAKVNTVVLVAKQHGRKRLLQKPSLHIKRSFGNYLSHIESLMSITLLSRTHRPVD